MGVYVTYFVLLSSLLVWYFSALPHHLRNARKSGLPYYVSPINPNNAFWLIGVSIVGYNVVQKLMPASWFDIIQLTIPGWEYRQKHAVHQRRGGNFILVSPGSLTLFSGDAETGYEILARRKDFGRIELAAKMMGAFGPNLISTDHDEWQRHRRIVSPALNERVMNAVWNESTDQTDDMIKHYFNANSTKIAGQTNTVMEDMKKITINVISLVGFGARRPWKAEDDSAPHAEFKMTFTDSLNLILDKLFIAVLVPTNTLSLPFMPSLCKRVGTAKREFSRYLEKIIAEEREQQAVSSTLITSLVKLADQDPVNSKSKTAMFLSEDEIAGNLFGFTIAGFDTTANTLTYCIFALALYPQWQDWIVENIDFVMDHEADFDYETAFPRLTRCLALMFETLRLFSPVSQVARVTHTDQQIQGSWIPAGTLVQVSVQSIHTRPAHWGNDSLEFRPSRWLQGGEKTPCEELFTPPKGTFMPWSSGPRFCPGLKLAQVEFVGIMARLFSKWRVEVVKLDGESLSEAHTRLQKLVADSSPRLTMQMNNPQGAHLKWIPR